VFGGGLPERALCVAAHPDDEILGAGATMAMLADRGCDVHVLILGHGVGARFDANDAPPDQVGELAGHVRDAAAIIGARPHHLSLPDNRFDSLDMLDVVKAVEAIAEEVDPDLVLTHHSGDLNVDHLVTSRAVLTAFRPLPGTRPVTLLAFETLSSTEWNVPSVAPPFAPNWFVDASAGLERKQRAMEVYAGELRDWPHPRSTEGIATAARQRGMTVGLESAEAFQLLRLVQSA
jgi:LmbE family N-acetylglucosaminyl deacetylase